MSDIVKNIMLVRRLYVGTVRIVFKKPNTYFRLIGTHFPIGKEAGTENIGLRTLLLRSIKE